MVIFLSDAFVLRMRFPYSIGHYGKPLDRDIVTNSRNSEHFTSLVEKPRSKPSRTLVDVVSGKYIVRACALKNKQNETLGLVLSAVPSKYTIKEIIKNSPAGFYLILESVFESVGTPYFRVQWIKSWRQGYINR